MRIAVMGTGGVGGYFGARLAQAGHEVAFVARGRQLDALCSHGLRVESPLGDIALPDVEVTGSPSEIGPVDLVLFTVKLWDTLEAAEAIKPLLKTGTGVVSFQNGVAKDDILCHVLGAEHVIGGVTYIAATIAEPGIIRHSGTLQKLVFGEYDGSHSPRVRQFYDACVNSRIDAEVSDRIEQTIWEKFVFLVGLSGTPAGMTSSMQNDLEQGNRLEVAWLSGDVVERGARLGVPTPCNRAISDILSVHSEGHTE